MAVGQRGLLARGVGPWLAAWLFWGCATSGGGCTALGPLPAGRYDGPKTSNAVNVRLSPDGITYLNGNWQALLEVFAPGKRLDLPVPCSITNVPVGGDVAVADQGTAGCTNEGCGQMDGKCDSLDAPVNVPVLINSFNLQPTSPDKLTGSVGITINTGKIFLSTVDRSHGACLYAGAVKCSVDYDTGRAAPANQQLGATITFEIDTRWDEVLSFKLAVDGTEVCGTDSSTPAPPRCLDPDDLDFTNEAAFWSGDCGVYCSVASWGFVKTFILEQISPMIQDQLKAALAEQSCEPCGTGLPACPSVAATSATSHCEITSGSQGKCVDDQGGQCVPRFPGLEGRIAVGDLVGQFGVPDTSKLDVSVAVGSTVTVDTGISLGTRAGVKAVEPAACVPTLPAPQAATVSAPNFTLPAGELGLGYHVGLSFSESFINQALYQAHQSGALCLQVSSSTVGVLNTGLVKAFLPSLGKLGTRDGKDAPMMAVFRPGKVPSLTVGQGTFDSATKKPIKPLLTVELKDFAIDVYVRLDDRYARLFTLTSDVKLPLSLIFSGCSGITPAIGDLKELVTNPRVDGSELLAEDPKVLVNLIPALVGLAEPVLATGLAPFNLPEFSGFKLNVKQARGLNPRAGTEQFEHLGLFAKLVAPGSQCLTGGPAVAAALLRVETPPVEVLRAPAPQGNVPYPTVVLHAESQPGAEVGYRVDDGLWTTFEPLAPGGELRVSHPSLLLQGRHVIHVRARMPDAPEQVSSPVSVAAVVDLVPPELTLRADRAAGRLDAVAHDTVSPDAALQWAYKVGQGPLTAWGEARVIDLASVEAAGGVEVQVKDEVGHVASARWRPPAVALRAESSSPGGGAGAAASCASAGGAPLGFLAALALAGLRRKKKQTIC